MRQLLETQRALVTRRSLMAGFAAFGAFHASGAAAATKLATKPELWEPRLATEHEGQCAAPGGSVWWRSVGQGERRPLIVIHGGPAATARSMFPYASIGEQRIVMFYDQLGCGKSDKPAEGALFTMNRFTAELAALQNQMVLPQVVLLGHGTGGWIAQAYALQFPDRVAGLILAGTSASAHDQEKNEITNLHSLGGKAASALQTAAKDEAFTSDAYQTARDAYWKKYLCRLPDEPDWLAEIRTGMDTNRSRLATVGADRFHVSGTLAGFDVRDRLKDIKAPTLVTCGQYDINGSGTAKGLARAIPGAKMEVFKGLSHFSHIEDPARVTATVARFIASLDPV